MLELRKEVENNTLVVFAKGQIDTATASQLQEAALGQKLGLNMVFDLKDTTYISSAGLRVILTVYKALNAEGKELKLRNVSKAIVEVLDMTGFTAFLKIE